ncbi:uncharacterized protein LOC114752076 [Neltuma alba]|uniref:uncharacterized protein LOC114752076 n=1 Tax=Neltuma alba TaxID=207710 RepID=UPI0010A4E40A|nr:uncharacterized protein LOC114752076 [Prosopis alba]
MTNFFSKFGSCYRHPRWRRPATDDRHLCHIGTSGDCRRVGSNRVYCRRNRPSHWRPALSVIMEDSLDQDHGNKVYRQSDKSSGKNKSVADVACISKYDDKESPMKPKIYISPFSATPYMF